MGSSEDFIGDFSASDLQAGVSLFALPSAFVISVAAMGGLPAGDKPEIAFAGRSNVGKSSLLNALLRRKSLVKTSKTPGHTRLLNFFALGEAVHLVDMPGYGYARAPKEAIGGWQKLTADYLRGRANLRLLCLLVDARRGFMAGDEEFCKRLDKDGVGYLIVLTKCDKLKKGEAERLLRRMAELLPKHAAAYPHVFMTSAEKGEGLAELRAHLAGVLDFVRS